MSKATVIGTIAFSMLGVSVLFGGCIPAPEESDEEEAAEDEDELRQFCGGIAAFPCPDGQICVDDPTDDCSPRTGGADCGGVCRNTKPPSRKACKNRDRDYASTDPNQCAAILFICVEGMQPFFDDCGCGCEPAPSDCSPGCGAGEYCSECKTIDGSGFFCLPDGTAC